MAKLFKAALEIFIAVLIFGPAAALLVAALIVVQTVASAIAGHRGWRGDTQQVSFDPNDPRRFIFGRTATAGALVTFQSWGNNNEYILLIFRVADHKCVGLNRVFWKGAAVSLGGGGAVSQFYADGHDNCWITFADGDWNQSANADMVAHSGGRWTSADKGRGVAYVAVKARYNEKAFTGGIGDLFQFVYEIDGMPLYDRRSDSSVGGSGSQRWNDTTTWTLNSNVAVVIENLLRGIRVEDTSQAIGSRTPDTFFGLALTDADLPFTENVAAMNACDQSVSLNGGGSENRYACGGVALSNSDVGTVLDDLCAAMAGKVVEGPGRWVILPGVAQSSVRTFTDDDLRLDGPHRYTQDISLDVIANVVTGRFADPAALYQPIDLPPRLSLSDIAADGGEKSDQADLSYVTSQTQGQRCQEIHRRRGRRQKTPRWAVAPENSDLEAGDWVTWNSARYGWTLTFEIQQSTPGTGDNDLLMVTLDLVEVDTAIFSWNPAVDELSRTAPVGLPSASPSNVTIGSLTAAADTITSGAEVRPIITVTIDAPTDPTVRGVRFYYRVNGLPTGATQVLHADFEINPAAVSGTLTFSLPNGIIGGYKYDVQATALVTPERDENLTAWVTTSAVTGATTASSPPLIGGTVTFSGQGVNSSSHVSVAQVDMTVGSGGIVEARIVISDAAEHITGSLFQGGWEVTEEQQVSGTPVAILSGTWSVDSTTYPAMNPFMADSNGNAFEGNVFVPTLGTPAQSGNVRYKLRLWRASGTNAVTGALGSLLIRHTA